MENTILFAEDFGSKVVERLKNRGLTTVFCQCNDVYKTNDTLHHAITFREKGKNCCPNIYIDGYQKRIESGECSLEDALEEVERTYLYSRDSEVVRITEETGLPEEAHYTIRMLNINKNEHYLSDTPYRMLNDEFALFVCGELDSNEDNAVISFKVTNGMIKQKGLNEDALFEEAFKNFQKEHFEIKTIVETLGNLGLPVEEMDLCPFNIPSFYVVSNEKLVNGANALARKDILDTFAEEHGDFYIIPSSIHELLFLPVSIFGNDVSTLSDMVNQVNRTEVSESDYLSDTIYLYSKDGLKTV